MMILIQTKFSMKATLCLLLLAQGWKLSVSEEQTCSWPEKNELDPALKEFTYDVGDGPK